VKLGQYLDAKGSDKLTVIVVSWLEGRYGGADAARLERSLRREVPPSAYVVQGTDALSKLFGNIESVPAYFLFDRSGKLVWGVGGGSDEQNQFGIETDRLDKVIAP
jgi:hypothetical protein